MTLRDALRRTLWIGFALVIVSIIAFWGLVQYGERYSHGIELPLQKLPVFFNAQPRNARDLALSAMRSVAQDSPNAKAARAELVRLGGAGLPHVLPEFDTLGSMGRGRVALAMMPIAERMGLVSPGELTSAEAAVPFWTRFWQDRAIDFRPQVVRRLVSRVAERSFALRREDIQHLDTYAISALIDQLGNVQTPDDVARVRRLIGILAHVTELPWRLERGATPAAAQALVERWHAFWDEHGADFSTLDGPRRVTAMATETRYAKWLSSTRRGGLGHTRAGGTALDLIRAELSSTLLFLTLVLTFGALLGLAWAYTETLAALHRPTRLVLSTLGVLFASLPLAMLSGMHGGRVFVLLAGILISGALLSRYARSLHIALDETASFWQRTRALLGGIAPALGLHTSFILSGMIALEIAFNLPGLGGSAISALRAHDVSAWMAVTLTGALILLVLRHVCDVLFAQRSGKPRAFLDEEPESS